MIVFLAASMFWTALAYTCDLVNALLLVHLYSDRATSLLASSIIMIYMYIYIYSEK